MGYIGPGVGRAPLVDALDGVVCVCRTICIPGQSDMDTISDVGCCLRDRVSPSAQPVLKDWQLPNLSHYDTL